MSELDDLEPIADMLRTQRRKYVRHHKRTETTAQRTRHALLAGRFWSGRKSRPVTLASVKAFKDD